MSSDSVTAVSTKARILEVAAALVAESPDGDVSTRAVCEAAGVGAPALYRHFGDKQGLLSAVVDHGWDKYLAAKRNRAPGRTPSRTCGTAGTVMWPSPGRTRTCSG